MNNFFISIIVSLSKWPICIESTSIFSRSSIGFMKMSTCINAIVLSTGATLFQYIFMLAGLQALSLLLIVFFNLPKILGNILNFWNSLYIPIYQR